MRICRWADEVASSAFIIFLYSFNEGLGAFGMFEVGSCITQDSHGKPLEIFFLNNFGVSCICGFPVKHDLSSFFILRKDLFKVYIVTLDR